MIRQLGAVRVGQLCAVHLARLHLQEPLKRKILHAVIRLRTRQRGHFRSSLFELCIECLYRVDENGKIAGIPVREYRPRVEDKGAERLLAPSSCEGLAAAALNGVHLVYLVFHQG